MAMVGSKKRPPWVLTFVAFCDETTIQSASDSLLSSFSGSGSITLVYHLPGTYFCFSLGTFYSPTLENHAIFLFLTETYKNSHALFDFSSFTLQIQWQPYHLLKHPLRKAKAPPNHATLKSIAQKAPSIPRLTLRPKWIVLYVSAWMNLQEKTLSIGLWINSSNQRVIW